MIWVEITPSPDSASCAITSRLLRCLSGEPASCAYARMLASRKTLPGIEIVARPMLTVRVAWVSVHQTKHFPHGGLPIGNDRLHQEFAYERMERCLMPLRIAAARLEDLVIQRKS